MPPTARPAVAYFTVLTALVVGLEPAATLAQESATDAPAGSATVPAADAAAPVGMETAALADESAATSTSGSNASSPEAANPAEDAAVPAPPVVRVHVRARRLGVEAHVRLGSHVVTTDGISRTADDYTLLCAPAPCDADVPAGVHLFAVSGTGGRALPTRDVDLAAGLEHTLEIDLDDRSGWRMLGTIVALVVGIPGLVAFLVSLIAPTIEHGRYDAVFIASGASLTAVGIAALPFAAWGDTREIVLVDPGTTE